MNIQFVINKPITEVFKFFIESFFNLLNVLTQPARNIPGMFTECSISVAMLRASREHLGNILKENIFKKILDRKIVFVLKVYDLTTANVDLFADSSNHKARFPEYLRNIPRISVSKTFQGYPWNIGYENVFYEVNKFKKLFCGLSCEIFNVGSLLS